MAVREPIIRLRLEDKDAVARLGKLAIEANEVRTSMKDLKAEIKETGTATTDQARQMGELVARQKNLSGQSRELSNDLSGLTAAGMRFRDKMADATLEAIKQTGILGQLAARSDTLTKEITELNASFKAGTITEAQYTEQQNQLQKELGETTASMTKMDAKLDELNKDFQTGRITAEQFKAGVASVNAETQKAAGAFSKGVADLKNYALGMVGVVAAVQGLRAVFSNVVGIIADFDKAQSRLAGILGTNKDGMAALTEQAKQLGATTAFTASQVSDAQTELAKLGFTQNEILASTPALLDLARGAGADISQAAEVAAGTLNAFGLSAEETTRLSDVMAKSFSSTALDIDKFTFGMRVVGPVAKNAGLSIEETTALLGVLADNNIRAESSGTGLRNILGKLAQTGMTFEDAMTQINTSTDKTKTAIDLFGLEASTVAIVLAENTAKTGELTAAFGKAGGAAKQLAKDMDDNLIGDQLKLTSAWEGFILSVDSGDGVISRTLRNLTTQLTEAIGLLQKINESATVGEGLTNFGRLFDKLPAGLKGVIAPGTLVAKLFSKDIPEGLDATNSAIDYTTVSTKDLEDQLAKSIAIRDAFLKQGKAEAADEGDLKIAVLQRFIEMRKANAETVVGTHALDDDTEATIANTDAKAKQAAVLRVITDELRAFIQAQKDIESGVGIGRMDVIGGIGSQSDIGTPESRLLPGDAQLAERTAAELESIEEVRAAQAAADAARQEAMQQTFNLLTSLGQLAKEGSTEAKVLAVAQAVAGAYLAVINALATFDAVPDPTGAVKFAKAASIGAAAFAAVARIKNAVGFEEGGYTPRASSNKKAVGVVHANEYVVPARMVQDPRYASVIAQLEMARRGMGFGHANGAYAVGGMVTRGTALVNSPTNPRPLPGELQAIENAVRMNNAPIFVRVEEINQVQGRVARIADRSVL
jgi:hypothetical protein